MGLAKRLETLSGGLRADGREALAAEYEQIWALVVGALEQFAAILGDTEMDAESFSRLFLLMLSRYDIGTIPVSPKNDLLSCVSITSDTPNPLATATIIASIGTIAKIRE